MIETQGVMDEQTRRGMHGKRNRELTWNPWGNATGGGGGGKHVGTPCVGQRGYVRKGTFRKLVRK